MEAKNNQNTIQGNSVIVHVIRVLVKLGIAAVLLINNNIYAFPLIAWLFISEALDQLALLLVRYKPQLKKAVEIFYILNSIAVITGIAFFAGWSLNDFYLVYLIHISSSTLAYGVKIGLISFTLSLLSYSVLLFINNALFELYLRLPILSVIVLRLLMSENRFEKSSYTLANILGVEKSKQDFIAIASHNLRTPVAAIYGYIDVLLRGDAGTLNEKQTTFLQRIRSNNLELEKLTEQLLQISILEVGKELNLLKQPTQIEMVVSDIVNNMLPVAQTKALSLTFNKPEILLPLVSVDVEKIKGVILNLVDNAIKYTQKGGVLVTAKQDGNFIQVSVQDSGVGIAQDEMPKLFGKFYRSGNILVYNQIGVGLGLYLGKKIVELLGGKLLAESTLGEGSIFTMTLPIIKETSVE